MDIVNSIPLFGSIANAVFILSGSLLGLALRNKLPPRITELPMQAVALFVFSLGVGMAVKTASPLALVLSAASGSAAGEFFDIEGRAERAAARLEARAGSAAEGFSSGFITASLIFCTGSMAVLGAFEEGLGGYPSLLLTKGLIDGLTSAALAASLGPGVLFAAAPVLVYQGILTSAAGWLRPVMTEPAVIEMSAAGGLMLMGIGVNLLGVKKLRVMNMLPALPIAVILARFFS